MSPDPKLPPVISDIMAQLMDAFSRLMAALPVWLFTVLVVALVVGGGIVIGIYMKRSRELADTEDMHEAPPLRNVQPVPENPAFLKYQAFLEEKGVPAKEFDSQMRSFADRFREMRQALRGLNPGEKSLENTVEQARDALDEGDFKRTLSLLDEIGKRESAEGQLKHPAALKHLMAAAISRSLAGDLQMAMMDYGLAQESYRQAILELPDFQEGLRAEYLNKLGTVAYQAGDRAAAISAFEQALKILERHVHESHPDVATALNNLALLQYSRGKYESAEPLYQRALEIDEKAHGDNHPDVATGLNNLALLYKKKGNLEAAEPLLRRAVVIKEKHFDPGHPSLVTGLKNYASLLHALGREEEADVFEQKATVLPPKRRSAATR